MILVDKNIKQLAENGMLILTNYNEENVNSMSYDVTIDSFVNSSMEEDLDGAEEYTLKPKEYVFIKTKEEIKIPNNLVGKVVEKNSLMRLGLFVSGPCYQPGHQTYCYLRVFNMSNKNINLKKDLKIAQIMFEFLQEVPEKIYSKDEKASFNNENSYLGLGKYENQYKDLLK